MSDLDDLQRLQRMLDEGRITAEEYARERAWITGSAAEDTTPITQTRKASTEPAAGHVIDLHEIEENEQSAPKASSKAPAKQGRPERSLPTVWKVILTAFVIWILLIATAVLWLRVRGVHLAEGQQVVVTQTAQGSETAQSAADDLQGKRTGEVSYETFLDQLEATLGTYYADHYSITDDGKTLTISLTGEGIAADAMYVVQGVDGAAAIWDELKVSMQSLAVTCYDGANADEPTRHVVLNILNDQNESNAILSYLDGQCIYDATQTPAE